MTAMRVLLFVLHVCILRECDGDGNASVGAGVWLRDVSICMVHVVQVLDTADDMLGMCVGRGVGGVCEMCMCERIGVGIYQSCKNRGGMECVSVFGL